MPTLTEQTMDLFLLLLLLLSQMQNVLSHQPASWTRDENFPPGYDMYLHINVG